MIRAHWYRSLLPAGLVALGAALLISGVDTAAMEAGLENAGVWAPVLFVVCGIALMSMLLPKTAVSLAAGALFGTQLGSLLLLLIAVTAALLNYAIGRWWLHDAILTRLQRESETGAASWARAVRELAADAGLGFHLLIRLAPIPTMLISYAMGAAGARLLPFAGAAALAVIPQMLWVHSGTLLSVSSDGPLSEARWISGIMSLTAAIGISYVVPHAAMRRIRAEAS
jgi:uncharacterized membrane protein YdjX (TVP38/TMEM64 family)